MWSCAAFSGELPSHLVPTNYGSKILDVFPAKAYIVVKRNLALLPNDPLAVVRLGGTNWNHRNRGDIP